MESFEKTPPKAKEPDGYSFASYKLAARRFFFRKTFGGLLGKSRVRLVELSSEPHEPTTIAELGAGTTCGTGRRGTGVFLTAPRRTHQG